MTANDFRLNIVGNEEPRANKQEYFIPVLRVGDQGTGDRAYFPVMMAARLEVLNPKTGKWEPARIGMWSAS